LVERSRHPDDGRRVIVTLLEEGKETIERVFPDFNKPEATFTDRLDDTEVHEMARLLRIVTATASDVPLVAGEGTNR
jgi:DNA-binding MarR family transcriptional regulator